MSADISTKKPFYKKWWVWLIVGVVVIGIASQSGKKDSASGDATAQSSTSSSGSDASEKPKEASSIKVSAKEYYEAYDGNEVAADGKYKDKLIEITGEVESVEKTLGTVYVALKGADMFGQVRCALEDESGASSISKGSVVTLVGTGDGKMASPMSRIVGSNNVNSIDGRRGRSPTGRPLFCLSSCQKAATRAKKFTWTKAVWL